MFHSRYIIWSQSKFVSLFEKLYTISVKKNAIVSWIKIKDMQIQSIQAMTARQHVDIKNGVSFSQRFLCYEMSTWCSTACQFSGQPHFVATSALQANGLANLATFGCYVQIQVHRRNPINESIPKLSLGCDL